MHTVYKVPGESEKTLAFGGLPYKIMQRKSFLTMQQMVDFKREEAYDQVGLLATQNI